MTEPRCSLKRGVKMASTNGAVSNESCCLGMFSSSKRSHPFLSDGDLEAFKNLSIVEREKALEELHGVADDTEETPDLLERCLHEIREELTKLPIRRRKCWDRAVFLRPSLEHDDKHMLLFLRGSRFDAKDAAKRLAQHYEHKAELFGAERLPHQITLDDLDEDDIACISHVSFQPLKEKDQAGRAVFYFSFSDMKFKHWKNQVRTDVYKVMAALEDEETQRKGLVDVVNLSRFSGGGKSLELLRNGGRFIASCPVRRVAFHVCYDEPKLRPIVTLVSSGLSKDSKARQRYHFGTPIECDYLLRGFGIKADELLWGDENDISAYVADYIARRRRIETERKQMEEQKNKEQIMCPTSLDILIGRGKPYQEYPGNLRLASLIAEFVGEYAHSDDKSDKTVLSLTIVQRAKALGSRFLQRTSMGWVEVDDSVAREKVVNALRVRGKQLREVTCQFPEPLSKRAKS
eukprot:Nitzschia sp. Nitz4//scaffold28_size193895//21364//22833//NITZ4_001625-RA/size193895-augustus-gene-0.289-mRNA-1//1//CDS//3329545862//5859//frame0